MPDEEPARRSTVFMRRTQYSRSPEVSRKIETPEGNLGIFMIRNYPQFIRVIQQQSKFADYGSEGLGFESLRLRRDENFSSTNARVSAKAGRSHFRGAPLKRG